MSHQSLSRNTSVWMGAQQRSSFWPHSLTRRGALALIQGFPHHRGCLSWRGAVRTSGQPAALSWGRLLSPWPCTEFLVTDLLLLLTRDRSISHRPQGDCSNNLWRNSVSENRNLHWDENTNSKSALTSYKLYLIRCSGKWRNLLFAYLESKNVPSRSVPL